MEELGFEPLTSSRPGRSVVPVELESVRAYVLLFSLTFKMTYADDQTFTARRDPVPHEHSRTHIAIPPR